MSRKTTPIQAPLSRRRPRPAQRIEVPDTRPFAALRDRRTGGAWGARGFSLLEVLVSLGIFAVGLIAVSAVFPTAITIQRETVRAMDGRRVAQNAKTMILAITRTNTEVAGFDDLPGEEISYNASADPKTGSLLKFFGPDSDPNITRSTSTNPNPVMPMIDLPNSSGANLDAPASFHKLFNLDTRSYPKNFYATDSSNNDVSALRRDYYWYPLIQAKGTQQGDNTKWFMFLIVMHRSGSQAPPEVRRSNDLDRNNTTGNRIAFGNGKLFRDDTRGNVSNDEDENGIPDYIQPGDRILADDGKVHTVILADESGITVDSPNVGNPGSIYFAVAIDGVTREIKTETRSPVVWIEESISLSVNK